MNLQSLGLGSFYEEKRNETPSQTYFGLIKQQQIRWLDLTFYLAQWKNAVTMRKNK